MTIVLEDVVVSIDDTGAGPAPIDPVPEIDLRTGGEAALAEAFARHSAAVHAFCRRAVGPDAAADVTQEVFVTAWRRRDRFDPERGSLAGWLIGIARNKSRDVHRRTQRSHALVDRVGSHEGRGIIGDDELDAISDELLVGEAVRELAPRAREAVELSFWGGLTHAEISERTGVPLGTVKSDIRRGLQRIRRHLEGRGLGEVSELGVAR